MPSVQFSRQIHVAAKPDEVWQRITDVPRLVEWVTIVHDAKELERLSVYEATLQDRLGPFKLRADLDIRVPEVQPGQRIRVTANGEDRHVQSRISVDGEAELTEHDGGTTLSVEGTYEVTGRVATLGSSVITKKAQTILDEFFGRLGEELG